MEKRILFVSDNIDSFLTTAMGKALEAGGYEVIYSKPRLKDLGSIKDFPPIFLIYLDGDVFLYNEALKFLGNKVANSAGRNKCYLYLIGNPIEIEAAYKNIPHSQVAGSFERPVNTSDIITELDLLSTDYSYDLDTPGVEHSAEEDASRRSLLLVDDDSTLLRSMQRWLSKTYNVFITNSGMNTISFLKKRKVDLVLLDYEMPVLSGLEVFQILKSDPDTANIPVIFLTSKDDKNTVIKVLEAKPASYLLKPMPPSILTQTVDEFFRKQQDAEEHPKPAAPEQSPAAPGDDGLEELEPID